MTCWPYSYYCEESAAKFLASMLSFYVLILVWRAPTFLSSLKGCQGEGSS